MLAHGVRRHDSHLSVKSLPTRPKRGTGASWTFVPEPESPSKRSSQQHHAQQANVRSPRSVDKIPIVSRGKRLIPNSKIRFTEDEISILKASQRTREGGRDLADSYDTRLSAAKAERKSIVELRAHAEEEEEEQGRPFRTIPDGEPVLSCSASCLFDFEMSPMYGRNVSGQSPILVEEIAPHEATMTAISTGVTEKVNEQKRRDAVRANEFVTSNGQMVVVDPPGRKRLLRRIRPRGDANKSQLPGPCAKSQEVAAILRQTQIAKQYKTFLKERNIKTPKILFGE